MKVKRIIMFRKPTLLLALVVLCTLLCQRYADATCTDYRGNEAGFNAAIAGLSKTLIDFDDGSVSEGHLITSQYASQNAIFSTLTGEGIFAEREAYGPLAYSPPLCAKVSNLDPSTGEEIHSSFTIDFAEPVWGTSFYVLDINTSQHVDFQVFDDNSQELNSYDVPRQGDYSYLAVLSDSKNIGSVIVTCDLLGDGIGFDDVTVVPEPATLSLLAVGGLALIRRKK